MSNYLKENGDWLKTSRIYVKVNDDWTRYTQEEFSAFTVDRAFSYGGFIDGEHSLAIIGISAVTGETYSLSALYDGRVIPSSSCTWTIVSGGFYATIDTGGTITILSSANGSNVTVRAVYSGLTATKTFSLTYRSGTSAQTETEIVIDESGNTTTTTTTTTTKKWPRAWSGSPPPSRRHATVTNWSAPTSDIFRSIPPWATP